MKRVQGYPPPSATTVKFGKGHAAVQKFRNAVNAVAQLAPAVSDESLRQRLLGELQTLMTLSAPSDAQYERWTAMLIRETNNHLGHIWDCLDAIKREAH